MMLGRYVMMLGCVVVPAVASAQVPGDGIATCSSGETLQSEVDAAPVNGPYVITVVGTCTENVLVRGRHNLRIAGHPSGATIAPAQPGPALSVFGSDHFQLENIAATRTISFNAATHARILNCTVAGPGTGVAVGTASQLTISGCTLSNNGVGLAATDGSSVFMRGPMTIENNQGPGIRIHEAMLDVRGPVRISGNRGGIDVDHGELDIGQGPEVTGNASFGVRLLANTNASIGGHITGNATEGVRIGAASGAFFGNGSIVSGNGDGSVVCTDRLSWVAGFLAGLDRHVTRCEISPWP